MGVQGTLRCPSCGHGNRSDRRFCAKCGARLGEVCSACGTHNDPDESFCGNCGAALTAAAPAPPHPEAIATASLPAGERRQLTVLFSDLVGSTALSQQLDPEDWRDIVTHYHNAVAEAVARFGGHVAQYLGDGVLVYFGWPQARGDDAERAVRAGLAILDGVVGVNSRIAPSYSVRLAARVGMHTGPLVIGDDGRVFGDTPNIAARIQAEAEPDTVVVSAATHQLVSGLFLVENRGPHALKGVEQHVTLYRVVAPSGVRGRLAVAAATGRGLTPFVGRDEERALLRRCFEQAAEGDGQVVLLVGEPGIGKSRLVETLRQDVAGTPHTWLRSGGSPYFENTPFYAVTELLDDFLAGTIASDPDGRVRALARAIDAAGLEATDAVPLVAPLIDLPIPEGYGPIVAAPEEARRRLLATLGTWVFGTTRLQPMVIVLEDLQWVDPSTLELQQLLVEQCATARLLLVYTARPEFVPPWPRRAHHTQLTLNRLQKKYGRELVQHVAAGEMLPADIVEAVVERTAGVPLFIEELTTAVVEAGTTAAARDIPATLADSLMARLDRLGGAKEVAQVGAVIGREFSYAVLHAVSPLPDAELQAALVRLADAELLYPRGVPPEATYVFKHALVQEAAYGALLRRTRQQLHARVAETLEQQFPERAASEPEVVARHYEAAGLLEQAVAYYQQAGEQAAACSAHEEAVAHLRTAIVVLGRLPVGDPDRWEAGLQRALAPSLTAVRGYAHPETEAAYERARVLYSATGDRENTSWALHGLANVCLNLAKFQRALDLIQQALEASGTLQDDVYIAAAYAQKSTIHYYQGSFVAALQHAETAMRLHSPAGRRPAPFGADEAVGSQSFSAWALWQLGYPDRALARARESIEFATTLDHPFSIAHARFFEIVVHWMRRDIVAQRHTAEELIRFAGVQGFPVFVGVASTFRGHALGDPAEIIDGLTHAAETGIQAGGPMIFAVLAEAYQRRGQLTEALGTVERGLSASAETGQHFHEAELQRLKGECILVDGHQSRVESQRIAEECFRRAIEIAGSQEAKSFELRAATSLARLWHDQGRHVDARTLLAPAYDNFTEGFETRDLIEAKALLDELA